MMFYCPVQVEASPILLFPHDVLLSCTGGVSPSLLFPHDVYCPVQVESVPASCSLMMFTVLYRWRPVQFSCSLMMFYCPVQVESIPASCSLMMYHCPVQVETSPILLFPHDVSLPCTGGGLSNSLVPLWCFTVLYRWRPVQLFCSLMMSYCPVQVEASPILLFPHDVLLSCAGGGQSNSPVPSWCVTVLCRWRPVQFSCSLMMPYCPVQVEASPSLLFPHDVLLSCAGGGQSNSPVPSWCLSVLYRWRPVPASCSLMMCQWFVQIEASPILLFPHDVLLSCTGGGQSQPPVSL